MRTVRTIACIFSLLISCAAARGQCNYPYLTGSGCPVGVVDSVEGCNNGVGNGCAYSMGSAYYCQTDACSGTCNGYPCLSEPFECNFVTCNSNGNGTYTCSGTVNICVSACQKYMLCVSAGCVHCTAGPSPELQTRVSVAKAELASSPGDFTVEKRAYTHDVRDWDTQIVTVFKDGSWALVDYPNDQSNPAFTVVWVGTRRTVIDWPSRTISTSFYAEDVGLNQLASFLKSYHKSNVLPDRAVLEVPHDFTEKAPSEQTAALARVTGRELSDCEQNGFPTLDRAYLSHQVGDPFIQSRKLNTPDGELIVRHLVYGNGSYIREDTIQGSTRKIIASVPTLTTTVYDPVGKSKTTYPWRWQDTNLIRDIVKSPRPHDPGIPDPKELAIPEGYTERCPSDAYVAKARAEGREPNPKVVGDMAAQDADYKKQYQQYLDREDRFKKLKEETQKPTQK